MLIKILPKSFLSKKFSAKIFYDIHVVSIIVLTAGIIIFKILKIVLLPRKSYELKKK